MPEPSKSSRVSRAARPSRRTGHAGGKCTICLEDLTVGMQTRILTLTLTLALT